MAQDPTPPPRSRQDSPIFRLVDAGRRLIQADRDVVAAAFETAEAVGAGDCLTCSVKVEDDGAKLCRGCRQDAAQAGAEIGARAVAPAVASFLEELLGGRPRLPPRR